MCMTTQPCCPLHEHPGSIQHSRLVNVGVEDAVHEADGGGFVGVGFRQLHMHLPLPTLVRACVRVGGGYARSQHAKRA